jgi:integrase
MRLSSLIAAFLKWCENARRPSTTNGYRRILHRFAQARKHKRGAKFGNMPLRSFKPIHLSTWGRTWHEVQAVQRLFQWAKDDAELVRRNVFARVPKPAAGQRTRILSPRELAGWLRKSGQHPESERWHGGMLIRPGEREFRDFLMAMRETMARPQEIRGLDWEMLLPEKPRQTIEEALSAGRAIFIIRDYKARERREDPTEPRILLVNRRLGRLLLRLRRRAPSLEGPVFCNSQGKRWTGNAVRCRFRRLRKKLCEDDVKLENIVAYTLRHSVATLALAAGVPTAIVMAIMGHTSARTTRRYQHLQVSHLRNGMEIIELERLERRAQAMAAAQAAKLKMAA